MEVVITRDNKAEDKDQRVRFGTISLKDNDGRSLKQKFWGIEMVN